MFFARSVVLTSALILASVVNALPLQMRAAAVNVASCTSPGTKFVEHDCNVALLGVRFSMSPKHPADQFFQLGGGIAGAM